MATRVELDLKGFKEMRARLRALPRDLTIDAQAIIGAAAYSAATAILAGYATHERSGELADGLTVEDVPATDAYLAVKRVVNNSAYAYPAEIGSAVRYTKTGAHRGAAPPMNVFIPEMERARSSMWWKLAAMMTEHGLEARVAA